MVRILTDSTSELSPAKAQELGVELVHLTVNFGETSYLDGVDLTPDDFFALLAGSRELPFTSQPSPEDFEAHFKQALDAGDEVVAILISGELSGTLQSARIARDDLGGKGIFVVDSRNASLALQLLVREVVSYRESHPEASGKEIAQIAEAYAARTLLYGVVDTLKYLHKGGRLSAASAVAGSVLGIKPILRIQDGRVTALDKARGLPSANEKLLELLGDRLHPGSHCMVGYSGDPQAIETLLAGALALGVEHPSPVNIGAVIGTHVGPGAAIIALFEDDNA